MLCQIPPLRPAPIAQHQNGPGASVLWSKTAGRRDRSSFGAGLA